MKQILFVTSFTSFLKQKAPLLTLLLLVFLICMQSGSAIAQSGSLISCPEDIVRNNDAGSCMATVTFPNSADVITNPNYSVFYSKNSGTPFVVGTTRVTKQLLDQNGAVLQTCTFNVTVLDKEAPVITNCPGDISVTNTTDSCGAVVTFTAPTVFEPCTLQRKDFYFTGAAATFVVPAGVTSIDVDARGAQGGHTFYNNTVYGNPGTGGLVYATIPVTPGQIFTVNVGGAGQNASAAGAGQGGFNGGGNGAAAYDENNVLLSAGGGGGGATDIRTDGDALTNRIIAVGGGGAHGFTQNGGDGGDLVGAHGALTHKSDINGAGGTYYATGGTQTAGGNGGIYQNVDTGGNGSLGIGGNGAAETFAGGGGAGYYGGGGGSFGSGAGGSSYIYADATNVYNGQGGQEGNGFVNFTYSQPATLVQTAGLPSGSTFPVGETINTFTATDAAGNVSTCTFKVIVTDGQAPVITAPANVTVDADNGSCVAANVSLGEPVTFDNCGVATITNDAPAAFPNGTTTVNWTVTDIHGNTSVATQTVTVIDNQKPVLTVPSDQTFTATTGSYTIPALVAADNCGIASITYSITGATARTGSSADASGTFNTGTSVISYTATDVHGNTATGSTSVTVFAAPVTSIDVTIPDVYAVSPGGKANTLYLGYGPSSVALKAIASGKSPYTYAWTFAGSKMVIGKSQTLAVFLPGTYVVTVTDAKGATGTFRKTIQVIDVRCGSKNEKVIVCDGKGKKPSTDCVNDNKVAKILAEGGSLGDCVSTSASAARTTVAEDTRAAGAVNAVAVAAKPEIIARVGKFTVYPNPAVGQFSVQLMNFKATKAEVILLSSNGMAVQRRTIELTGSNQSITINTGNVAPGFYLLKVITAEGVKSTTVSIMH